jgi:hypothetical protein
VHGDDDDHDDIYGPSAADNHDDNDDEHEHEHVVDRAAADAQAVLAAAVFTPRAKVTEDRLRLRFG